MKRVINRDRVILVALAAAWLITCWGGAADAAPFKAVVLGIVGVAVSSALLIIAYRVAGAPRK